MSVRLDQLHMQIADEEGATAGLELQGDEAHTRLEITRSRSPAVDDK